MTPNARLAAELEAAADREGLLRDDVWLRVASESERQADRAVAELLRAKEREQRKRAGLAQVRRDAARARVDTELAGLALSDELWTRRALSERSRLTDPNVRLAELVRARQWTDRTLLSLIVLGTAWAAWNVQQAVVIGSGLTKGDPGWWLAFAIEPLLSWPLIVVMRMQATAAAWGRTLALGGLSRRALIGVQLGVLTLVLLLNAGPFLPVEQVGTWRGVIPLVGHLVPPVMIGVAVVLQYAAGRFFASLLVDAVEELEETARLRVDEGAAPVIALVSRIRGWCAEGRLVAGDDGYPSVSAVQRVAGVGKRQVQGAVDVLRLLFSPADLGFRAVS